MDSNQVNSAAPQRDMSPAARQARYADLRKKLGMQKLSVVGEKDRHYFWANISNGEEMIRLESVDYETVREPHAKEVLAGKASPKVTANGLKEDGTYQVGDVILMSCDEEVYEFLMLLNEERHQDMVSGAQRDFQTEASRLAVPVFEHIK